MKLCKFILGCALTENVYLSCVILGNLSLLLLSPRENHSKPFFATQNDNFINTNEKWRYISHITIVRGEKSFERGY